jgi:hypothetical protein
MNGNCDLSKEAQHAVGRIRTLRLLTTKTGLQTREEQFRVLLSLSDEDAIAVADAIGGDGPRGTR